MGSTDYEFQTVLPMPASAAGRATVTAADRLWQSGSLDEPGFEHLDARGRAGQNVVGCGLSCHPSSAVARVDSAALHGGPEGDVLHGADVVEQAPACVQAIETVRPQGRVQLIRHGGFSEESFKVRGGHHGLFPQVHSCATVRLQRLSLRPCTRLQSVPTRWVNQDSFEFTEFRRACPEHGGHVDAAPPHRQISLSTTRTEP